MLLRRACDNGVVSSACVCLTLKRLDGLETCKEWPDACVAGTRRFVRCRSVPDGEEDP